MKAYVLIDVRPGEIKQVLSLLRRLEGVVEAYMTFGPYDIVVTLETRDIQHLGSLLSNEIQPIPGIQETLTCLAVES